VTDPVALARPAVQRTSYRPPDLALDQVELIFDLDPDATVVEASLSVRRAPESLAQPLWLHGEQLELLSVQIDGRPLDRAACLVEADGLRIDTAGASTFRLTLRTRIHPRANSELLGLYCSESMLLTQCEAEGFRRITYFPDRPDVLARYEVLLRADRSRFPVLLSNGNLAGEGALADGRHFARWVDPHPKPSYLFALVAGTLQCREQRYTTRSGRSVLLQLWAAAADLPRLEHAAQSLERAIAWDETRFGLELDLDRYMVVAARDFNFGAMENKGLNLFSTRYVLADAQIATDEDFAEVEATIAHEYFHNWTGNRVTCRDWFQLCLKEGLTVYREQEFVHDMLARSFEQPAGALSARSVPRIEAIRKLRTDQFAEDAGPLAHPVRPDSYREINNFYTATVYEKGAEVVRMLATLAGPQAFRRGFDLFIQRHDGKAASCEDFVEAIAEASGLKLDRFMHWYGQAGTPRVAISPIYDAQTRCLELGFVQSAAPSPGQPNKEATLIPLEIGLLGPDGRALPLYTDPSADASGATPTTCVLALSEPVQSMRFFQVPPGAVPSLLRNFSAPVRIEYPYDDGQLILLARHDADPCNRWDALQRLMLARLGAATDAIETDSSPVLDDATIALLREVLVDAELAPAFRELVLRLPAESLLADARSVVVPEAIHLARVFAQGQIGRRLRADWQSTYRTMLPDGPYRAEPAQAGRRALKNLALEYLVAGGDQQALALVHRQLADADNLTDRYAALRVLVNSASPAKAESLLKFARDWQGEPLLMNKWFHLQATSMRSAGEPPVLARVRMLLRHAAYSERDPQAVRALVLGFCADNPAEFHLNDGSGYAFWTEQVARLDCVNPILAARLARCLESWRRFVPDRRDAMRLALEQLAARQNLSADVREVVQTSLDG